MDPQCNLTDHLGVEVGEGTTTVYDVLTAGRPARLGDRAHPDARGSSWRPREQDLAGVEVELAGWPGREGLLRKAIQALPRDEPGGAGGQGVREQQGAQERQGGNDGTTG